MDKKILLLQKYHFHNNYLSYECYGKNMGKYRVSEINNKNNCKFIKQI